MDRRTAIGLGTAALAALSVPASAQAQSAQALPPNPDEVLPLWPRMPPGGPVSGLSRSTKDRSDSPNTYRDRIVAGVVDPTISVLRPQNPDGSAMLIVPGGGYNNIVLDREGYEPARRFNQAGVTAFVLQYRLPGEGWAQRADVPLQDAQRAMRLLRANPALFGIDPRRIGVIGFSAGGHLAASLATRAAAHVYAPVDAADDQDAAPAFAALIYPVITMLPPFAHEASREKLLGEHPAPAFRAAYSCEKLVTGATPPTFLVASADDPDVPVDNTLAMLASLRGQHVSAEMHVFEEGGHGFAIRRTAGKPVAAWPDLLLRWCARHGFVRGAV